MRTIILLVLTIIMYTSSVQSAPTPDCSPIRVYCLQITDVRVTDQGNGTHHTSLTVSYSLYNPSANAQILDDGPPVGYATPVELTATNLTTYRRNNTLLFTVTKMTPVDFVVSDVRSQLPPRGTATVSFTSKVGEYILLTMQGYMDHLGIIDGYQTGENLAPNHCSFSMNDINHRHGDVIATGGGQMSNPVESNLVVTCTNAATVNLRSLMGYRLPGDQPGLTVDLLLNGLPVDLDIGGTGTTNVTVTTRFTWSDATPAGPINGIAILVLDVY